MSGSFPDIHHPSSLDERKKIEAISQEIGRMLIQKDYRLVSGFGLVVGSSVLSGALQELNTQAEPNYERSLQLRPFPQLVPSGFTASDFYKRYREALVRQAGACIIIAGTKQGAKKLIIADGVVAEFEAAVAAKRIPIPVGVTGGAAAALWKRVDADYKNYCGKLPRKWFNTLNDANAAPGAIARAVREILLWAEEHGPKM